MVFENNSVSFRWIIIAWNIYHRFNIYTTGRMNSMFEEKKWSILQCFSYDDSAK